MVPDHRDQPTIRAEDGAGDRPREGLLECGASVPSPPHAHVVIAGSSDERAAAVERRASDRCADSQLPQVMLRPFEDREFFPAGVKHRYTRG